MSTQSQQQKIEDLLNLLKTEPLDPRFEEFGNFVAMAYGAKVDGYDILNEPNIVSTGPRNPEAPDAVNFFGNFYRYSFVFNIDTDEVLLINQLTAAIRSNQLTTAYKNARKETIK